MSTLAGALNAKSLLPGFYRRGTIFDKSIAFYEALGFTVAQRWDDNGTPIGVMMQAGELQVGFEPGRLEEGRNPQKGLGTRLNIETPQNIDEIAARVKGAGYTIDVEPLETGLEDPPVRADRSERIQADDFQRMASQLSAASHKYGDAPRAARRPDGKARRLKISGIFEGGATPPAGIQSPAECHRIYERQH